MNITKEKSKNVKKSVPVPKIYIVVNHFLTSVAVGIIGLYLTKFKIPKDNGSIETLSFEEFGYIIMLFGLYLFLRNLWYIIQLLFGKRKPLEKFFILFISGGLFFLLALGSRSYWLFVFAQTNNEKIMENTKQEIEILQRSATKILELQKKNEILTKEIVSKVANLERKLEIINAKVELNTRKIQNVELNQKNVRE